MPLEAIPPIDERYLADALESVPLVKGDNVMIPYFGGRLTFQIKETTPENAVVVTRSTIFEIKDKVTKTPRIIMQLQKEYDSIIDEIKKMANPDEPIDINVLKKKTEKLKDIEIMIKDIQYLKID